MAWGSRVERTIITSDSGSLIEIPYFVTEAIESWERVVNKTPAKNATKVVRMAAKELRGLSDKTPELYGTIEQAIAELSFKAGVDFPDMVVEATTLVGDDWIAPAPIKSALPAVEPFIPELLPDALRDYVMDVAAVNRPRLTSPQLPQSAELPR